MTPYQKISAIPLEDDHVPWQTVTHDGRLWVIYELRPEQGLAMIQRPVTADEVEPAQAERPVRQGLPIAASAVWAAVMAVFLFLLLLSSIGAPFKAADAVGVVVGFSVLLWLLDRRQHPRP